MADVQGTPAPTESAEGEVTSEATETVEAKATPESTEEPKQEAADDKSSEGRPKPKFYRDEQGKFRAHVKVKGKESELVYESEDDVVRDVQRGRYMGQEREEVEKARTEAQKMKAEAEEQTRAVQELISMLRNPKQAKDVYRALGADPAEVSKEILRDFLEEQNMTPEQKELAQYRRKEQEWKQREEAEQKAKQEAEFKAATDAELNKLGNTIMATLKLLNATDQDSFAVRRIASLMEADPSADPEMLAELYREEFSGAYKRQFGSLDGKGLYELLGDEGLKKANEYAAARLKKTPSLGGPPKKNGHQPGEKIKDIKAYWAEIEKKAEEEAAARGSED